MVALIYNWWSRFVRLADPERHREAITARPLLLSAIAQRTRHAGRVRLVPAYAGISSTHAALDAARRACLRIAGFPGRLRTSAEQLDLLQRWYRILIRALRIDPLRGSILHGRQPRPPHRLKPA